MAYIDRTNPHEALTRRTVYALGDLGATSAITSVASSFGTSTQNLLLLAGGGAILGWLANDLVIGARKQIRKARRSASQFSVKGSIIPILFVTALAGGGIYYYVTHKNAKGTA